MMMLGWFLLECVHLGVVLSQETCLTDPLETACEFPNSLTLISQPNKLQVDEKNCGAEYNKADWKEQPTIIYPGAKLDKSYAVICVDPDPPGYEKGEYYLHWLMSNIRGEDLMKGDLSNGNKLTGYYGPNPPAGSGVHRYMFLVFEEFEKNQEVENPKGRPKFEFGSWLERQNNFCKPVAGIQFNTQF